MSCLVCDREDRESIERDLAAGIHVRDIAARIGIGKSTVSKHRAECMVTRGIVAAALERTPKAGDPVVVKTVQERIAGMDTVTAVLYAHIIDAVQKGRRPALALVRVWLANAKAALDGQSWLEEHHRGPGAPEDWGRVRMVLLRVLSKYPEAKVELLEALGEAVDVN